MTADHFRSPGRAVLASRPLDRDCLDWKFMHPMLNTAIKAARRAGSVIQRGARDLDRLTVTSKGPKDFVSEVDRAAEAAIVETLLDAYPDHGILAEEGTVNSKVKNPDSVWIIDPLDGTT